MSWLSPKQRKALSASAPTDADGSPLSAFASPPVSPGKRRRVRALGASLDPSIRESAALSAHAPPDVLIALAADEMPGVRACVARNPGASQSTLRRLAEDVDPLVRGWVAAHPAVPADVRVRLRDDSDAQVRAVVAWAVRWDRD